MIRNVRRASVLAALCLGLTACSSVKYEPIPETGATLTGTVKYKNEPLRVGMVIVAGKTGATAEIGDDGRYTVPNAPIGDVTIAINLAAARGKMMGASMGKSPAEKAALPKIPNIPGKYSDPGSSPLKTTVNKGQNTFDIVIE
jgi:hypothetical protein